LSAFSEPGITGARPSVGAMQMAPSPRPPGTKGSRSARNRWSAADALLRLFSAVLVEIDDKWAADTKTCIKWIARMPDPLSAEFPDFRLLNHNQQRQPDRRRNLSQKSKRHTNPGGFKTGQGGCRSRTRWLTLYTELFVI